MDWLDRIVGVAVPALILGLPAGTVYAAYRVLQDRNLTGWRIWVGRVGALYSAGLLAMAIVCFVWPHPGECIRRAAAFPLAAIGLIFALFAKGKVRWGIALASIGAGAFFFALMLME